jgi:hypothetical protein
MDTLHHLAGIMMMFCSRNPYMKIELRISGLACLLVVGYGCADSGRSV